MTFENRSGVFVVRYSSREALAPGRQVALEAALREASVAGPVGVVFVVAPEVRDVSHEVPDYWIGITADRRVQIAAMAVVTPNPAVSVATRGFSAANILKDTAVSVRPFPDERSATEWVASEVASARAKLR